MPTSNSSELQVLLDRYKTSVFDKDTETFLSIFDSNLHVFDMWAQWSLEGLDAWREMAKGWFGALGSDRVVVDFDDIKTSVTGEMGMATAFVTFTAVSKEGQDLRSMQNRLTWVVQKKSGTWKVIHEHTSAPIDHATMKAMLKR